MLLVPGAIIALIGAHLYLVVKLGTTAPAVGCASRVAAAETVVATGPGAAPPQRLDGRRETCA